MGRSGSEDTEEREGRRGKFVHVDSDNVAFHLASSSSSLRKDIRLSSTEIELVQIPPPSPLPPPPPPPRSESSSFTALAMNKPYSSSSSYSAVALGVLLVHCVSLMHRHSGKLSSTGTDAQVNYQAQALRHSLHLNVFFSLHCRLSSLARFLRAVGGRGAGRCPSSTLHL